MATPNFPKAVTISLYRTLFKEAVYMDSHPLTKTLFPLPKKVMPLLGVTSQLYRPNGISYKEAVRKVFRSEADASHISIGFDILNKIKAHQKVVDTALPQIAAQQGSMSKQIVLAAPTHKEFAATLQDGGASVPVEVAKNAKAKAKAKACDVNEGYAIVKRDVKDMVEVGLGLLAHPLSSAHVDRRVVLIVEKTDSFVTGLVMDMAYSFPLSHGNPMFPEVLWGHEVYNGGYCHVDFTMPPTANVSVLHQFDAASEPKGRTWLSGWRRGRGKGQPQQHHEALCKEVIRGYTDEAGVKHPSLFYSRVEALPYVANLAMGQRRDHLRVYWGCMRWPTNQLPGEIHDGHWIPVKMTPSFFRSYPMGNEETGGAQRFHTKAKLEELKSLRVKCLGADVSPPQIWPPEQPLCRRDPLWDQLMFSLQGEFVSLVGTANPFVHHHREHSGAKPPLPEGLPQPLPMEED
jgi:hypothetical protein